MDYAYIKEHLDDIPENEIDFINKLERGCKSFDISIKNENGKLKSTGELFNDITIALLKYSREIGEISFIK
jgi:hypothetical protein